MRYGSVCSGIEAATAAWHPLGWEPAFLSEIEKFPRAVLRHHYPDVPLHGDFTTIGADEYGPIDLLVGGTPCQSFSVAGLRKGMDDDRGNLALEFLRLAKRKRPKWIVWENVPGVLSSGRDFGAFLGALVECGYGFTYRILDAQYVRVQSHPRAVPQRRRRVFVVGYLGDWRHAGAVLLEREGLRRHPPPRREKREDVAKCPRGRAQSRHREGIAVYGGGQTSGARDVAATLAAHGGGNRQDFEVENFVVHGSQDPIVQNDLALPVGRNSGLENVITTQYGNIAGALTARHNSSPCADRGQNVVAFAQNTRDEVRLINGDGQIAGNLAAETGARQQTYLAGNVTVRRLTPMEAERLQGFPDNFTQIPWRNKSADKCPDGPRYKALGNSMAVPVMSWIGQRINQVNALERVA